MKVKKDNKLLIISIIILIFLIIAVIITKNNSQKEVDYSKMTDEEAQVVVEEYLERKGENEK